MAIIDTETGAELLLDEEGRVVAKQVETPDDVLKDYKVTPAQSTMITSDSPPISNVVATGIDWFDDYIKGGLPKGLTIIGAQSSMGKSAFCGMIADSLALAGHIVLYVNMEMSSHVLIARSQSRIIKTTKSAWRDWIPASKIINHDNWDAGFKEVLDMANVRYLEGIAPNFYYWDSDKPQSTTDIENVALTLQNKHGKPPVIFVDYLQLLGTDDTRNDKQRIDDNILDLRTLARRLNSPIVLISSLNRASTGNEVSFASFSGSSGIEYSADLLIGLQPILMHKLRRFLENKMSEKKRNRLTHRFYSKIASEPVVDVELVVKKMRDNAMPNGKHGLLMRFRKPYSSFEHLAEMPKEARFDDSWFDEQVDSIFNKDCQQASQKDCKQIDKKVTKDEQMNADEFLNF